MIKFLSLFVRANRSWIARIFNRGNLKRLHLLHKAGVGYQQNAVFRNFFVVSWWRAIIPFYLKVNFVFIILVTGGMIFFQIINFYLVGTGYGSFFEWIPFSLSEVCSYFGIFFMIISGWTTLVLINHLGEIAALVIGSQEHGIIAALAFVQVVAFTIPADFFMTLFTNPYAIWDIALVHEVILWFDTIGSCSSFIWTQATSFVDLFSAVGKFLLLTKIWISEKYYYCLFALGGLIKASFNGLVAVVFGLINPSVPTYLSPFVTPIFKGLATTISIGIIMWILRTFFGFPF